MIKKAKELIVGDIVKCRISDEQPWAKIEEICSPRGTKWRTMNGLFAVAYTNRKKDLGFSLWEGQEWEVL